MSTTKRDFQGTQDWKSTLAGIRADMIRNLPEEEKKAYQLEQQQAAINRKRLNELKPEIYSFLAGYKQNSGIFVNNFSEKGTLLFMKKINSMVLILMSVAFFLMFLMTLPFL